MVRLAALFHHGHHGHHIISNSLWLSSPFLLIFFSIVLQADEDPQFDMFLQSGRSRVLQAGGTAVYTLVMFTPVDTVAPYELDVVVPNDTLSICRAHMRYSGDNVPCFDDSRHKTSYLSYEEDGHVDRAYLDLGPIRNTGKLCTCTSTQRI